MNKAEGFQCTHYGVYSINEAVLLSTDFEGYCCGLAPVQSSLACRCLQLHRNVILFKAKAAHFSQHAGGNELSKAPQMDI